MASAYRMSLFKHYSRRTTPSIFATLFLQGKTNGERIYR